MNNTLIIFGGTGDLTHRKLLPALYNLLYENHLPEDFAIVSIGRRPYDNNIYHNEIYNSLQKHTRHPFKEETWNKLKNHLYYYELDFTKDEGFCDLNDYLNKIDTKHNTNGKRIYYLAVAPEYFPIIVRNLHKSCMKTEVKPNLVIEKPFGKDLASAKALNKMIVSAFGEKNIYRIDHYLGKEMLQNIMVIRFANAMFEPIWNSNYIEQVQISSYEDIGIGTRGNYYETAGAIRDMVQSHLLQILSLIAMEKPENLNPETIRNEKVKVLKALRKMTPKDVYKNVVRGQYESYRKEVNVDSNSNIETYLALKAYVDNQRWRGVPFYIRTGKMLPKKTTEVIIQFKDLKNSLYPDIQLSPNYLVIKVQPHERIFVRFNAKRPGNKFIINPINMDFCQNCEIGTISPEAYERLLSDVMKDDATLFARWDEVEYSWKFIDQIVSAWKDVKPIFPNYEDKTWGPKAADYLLAKDNHHWINLDLEDEYENI